MHTIVQQDTQKIMPCNCFKFIWMSKLCFILLCITYSAGAMDKKIYQLIEAFDVSLYKELMSHEGDRMTQSISKVYQRLSELTEAIEHSIHQSPINTHRQAYRIEISAVRNQESDQNVLEENYRSILYSDSSTVIFTRRSFRDVVVPHISFSMRARDFSFSNIPGAILFPQDAIDEDGNPVFYLTGLFCKAGFGPQVRELRLNQNHILELKTRRGDREQEIIKVSLRVSFASLSDIYWWPYIFQALRQVINLRNAFVFISGVMAYYLYDFNK